MAKAKMWKIGTSVESYIDTLFGWMETYDLDIDDVMSVQTNKKNGDIIFTFNSSLGYIEVMDKTKAQQLLKCLLTFRIIEAEAVDEFANDNEMLANAEYKISADNKGWRENFIKYLETLSYIDAEDNQEEELKFLFKNQKNAIYSILKAFEVYSSDEINKYDESDKKIFSYWNIPGLFRDFEKELEIEASRIIHPLSGRIKQRRDMDNITWKDFEIKNLSQVKDKEIESDLWNLADILSSTKSISIPIMQRKYVWDKNLVDKLMDDIFEIGENKPFHYIGSIVYKEKNNSLRILDGQQRLTTMFLILTALYSFYTSEDASYYEIEVPKYFKKIFPKSKEDQKFALHNRFKHVYGNLDFDEFSAILGNVSSPKKSEQGNMTINFEFAQEKIKSKFNTISEKEKQDFLEDVFVNTVERVAFTVNKNQIENEYSIFEKLNTLSQPLTQIDLMKNHILPYCNSDELDEDESKVQTAFYSNISSKFEKGKKISEPSVKKFVNYFIQLNGPKYLKKNELSELKPFEKLSVILERKYNLVKDKKTFKQFLGLLKDIGAEIDSFLSITDRTFYTVSTDQYYNYSDLLASFDQRYVYAPLIKQIFDLFDADQLSISKAEDKVKMNKVRALLFEVERYELLLQVVLYRGQSITSIIEKVSKEISDIVSKKGEITPQELRNIFSNEKVMSANLIAPRIETLQKKVSEDSMADKVSVLILNRVKFWYNNKNKIELDTSFKNEHLSKPSREHIMPQKITSLEVKRQIFNSSPLTTQNNEYSDEEFNRLHKSSIDMIGNIIMIEQSDNSEFANKSPRDKAKKYNEKPYLENDPTFVGINTNKKNNPLSLKAYLKSEQLGFDKIKERSNEIANLLTEIFK